MEEERSDRPIGGLARPRIDGNLVGDVGEERASTYTMDKNVISRMPLLAFSLHSFYNAANWDRTKRRSGLSLTNRKFLERTCTGTAGSFAISLENTVTRTASEQERRQV